jgi:hypothetical protein
MDPCWSISLNKVYGSKPQAIINARRTSGQRFSGTYDNKRLKAEYKKLFDQRLPGASVKRRLLWRYTLVYSQQINTN